MVLERSTALGLATSFSAGICPVCRRPCDWLVVLVASEEKNDRSILVRVFKLLYASQERNFLFLEGVILSPEPSCPVNTSIIVQPPRVRFLEVKNTVADLALMHRCPSSPQRLHHHLMIAHVP